MEKITNLIQISKQDFINNLSKLDKNTLYFVIEENSDFGHLYLGNKNMLGVLEGEIELKKLADVALENSQLDNGFLFYEPKEQKWICKNRNELVFIGTNGVSNGIAGLVPPPGKESKNHFLRGDGTWAPAANFQWKEF